MSIIMDGIELNQDKLDAIVPVINGHMNGRVSKRNFDKACRDAMEKAGCPIDRVSGERMNIIARNGNGGEHYD